MLRRQKQLSRAAEKAKGEALRGDRTRLDTFHKIEVTLAPWCRDKMTRTSAGLGRVIQEQSSFELSYVFCTLFRSRPLLSTTPLKSGCFLHEGLPSLTIEGRARARALNV